MGRQVGRQVGSQVGIRWAFRQLDMQYAAMQVCRQGLVGGRQVTWQVGDS